MNRRQPAPGKQKEDRGGKKKGGCARRSLQKRWAKESATDGGGLGEDYESGGVDKRRETGTERERGKTSPSVRVSRQKFDAGEGVEFGFCSQRVGLSGGGTGGERGMGGGSQPTEGRGTPGGKGGERSLLSTIHRSENSLKASLFRVLEVRNEGLSTFPSEKVWTEPGVFAPKTVHKKRFFRLLKTSVEPLTRLWSFDDQGRGNKSEKTFTEVALSWRLMVEQTTGQKKKNGVVSSPLDGREN